MVESQLGNSKSRAAAPICAEQKTHERSYYMSEDPLLDTCLFEQDQKVAFCVVLRKNNQIQIMDGGETVAFLKTDSTPLCISAYRSDKQVEPKTQKKLVGLVSGRVLCVEMRNNKNKRTIRKLWEIQQIGNKVTGILELPKVVIISRPSVIELWTKTEDLPQNVQVYEKSWARDVKEAVVDFSYLADSGSIIYVTYSGKVYTIDINKQKRLKETQDSEAVKNQTETLLKQIAEAEAELKSLKAAKMQKEKVSQNRVENYKFNYNLSLNPSILGYTLQIFSSLPIVSIAMNGEIRVKQGSRQLGYQKQEQCYIIKLDNELNPVIEFTARQGQESQCQCFVTLRGEKELVTSFRLDLKLLCLHYKIDNAFPKQLARQKKLLNVLTLQGKISKSQINSLFAGIFPEILKTLPDSDTVTIAYESFLTKQKLVCEFSDSIVKCYSESLNPAVTIKKYLFQKSKQKNLSLRIKLEPSFQALRENLRIMEPKLQEFHKTAYEYQLLPGLLELKTQLSGTDRLNEGMKKILERETDIRKKFAEQQAQYKSLKENIVQLYRSYQLARDVEVSEFQVQNLKKKLEGPFMKEEIEKIMIG